MSFSLIKSLETPFESPPHKSKTTRHLSRQYWINQNNLRTKAQLTPQTLPLGTPISPSASWRFLATVPLRFHTHTESNTTDIFNLSSDKSFSHDQSFPTEVVVPDQPKKYKAHH